MRRDKRLSAVIRQVGPCTMEHRGDPYRMLLRSVIYQQLAGAAARTIDTRLRAAVARPLPAARGAARGARRTAARGRTLAPEGQGGSVGRRGVAARDVTNRALRAMDDDAVIAAVTQIHGIGEWTAHMLLMFSLGRPDVLPVGDYGVRKGAMQLYGLRDLPKPKELEALAEPWRPYRSVASWYLWRVVDTIAPGA
jgi:3-methyladenine DNA glycosylase/8-oxoguanine DNA glycosylase